MRHGVSKRVSARCWWPSGRGGFIFENEQKTMEFRILIFLIGTNRTVEIFDWIQSFFFFNFLLGTMRIRKNRSDIRSYKFCWKNSVTIHNHQLLQIISIWNRFDRSRLPVRFGSENRKFSQTKMFRRVMAGTDFSDIRSFWLEISWFELWYEWNEIKTNNGQDGKRRLVFFSFREMRRDVKDVLKLFRNFSFSVLLNFLTQILNYYSTSSSIAHDFTV